MARQTVNTVHKQRLMLMNSVIIQIPHNKAYK